MTIPCRRSLFEVSVPSCKVLNIPLWRKTFLDVIFLKGSFSNFTYIETLDSMLVHLAVLPLPPQPLPLDPHWFFVTLTSLRIAVICKLWEHLLHREKLERCRWVSFGENRYITLITYLVITYKNFVVSCQSQATVHGIKEANIPQA